MYVISNAMIQQAEIVQTDRWNHGPLELVFCPEPRGFEEQVHINSWNRHHRGGVFRETASSETVHRLVPSLEQNDNPNVFIVPTRQGYSQLHRMLASVVPKSILRSHGIRKRRSTMWLWPLPNEGDASAQYAAATERAFGEYIWAKLSRGRGVPADFASNSSLRLLAGDTRFWMHRLYRIALARADELGPTQHEDDDWQPLDELWALLRPQIPTALLPFVHLTRPYYGGSLWDPDNPTECEDVVEEMLDGYGVMESLNPVLEVFLSQRAHEDFSARYSWVKEDFERSFYSKRSKVRVTLLETTDEAPVWSAREPSGYENVLFRDILAAFNAKDRRVIIALRHGKTVSEISRHMGHRGHAAISRKVADIKRRLRPLLGLKPKD